MERISVSDIVAYSRCRFALGVRSRQGMNLHPPLPATALFLGSAGHHAVGWQWIEEMHGRPVSSDSMQGKTAKICEEMLVAVEGHIPDVRTNVRLMDGIGNLVAAIRWWPAWCRRQDELDQFDMVDVETPVRLQVTDNLLLSGRLDRVLQHRQTGRVYIDDYKTAATIYTGDEEYRPQFVLYGLIGYSIYGDRFGGFITDYMRKTPPAKLKWTTRGPSLNKQRSIHHMAFVEAVRDAGHDPLDYGGHILYLKDEKTPKYFRRVKTNWPTGMFDRIHGRVMRQVEEVYDYCQAFKKDMTSVAWCDWNPITCRGCGYREPCMMFQRGHDVTRYLQTTYTSEEIIPGLEAFL